MPTEIRTICITLTKCLTIVNGFLFGILGGFSPLHTNLRTREVPVFVNLTLLVILAFVLYAEIRVNYF